MATPSVNLRHWWLAAIGGGLLVAMFSLAIPGPQPGAVPLTAAPPAPPVPATVASTTPLAAAPERRDVTAPLLQVIDWQGQPIACSLTFLANDALFPSDCPPTGVVMPAAWSHVLVQSANWLPLCLPATAVESRTQGCWLLRLPEPSLTARVVAPADAEPVQLYAEVDLATEARSWPAVLREHVFGTAESDKPLRLELWCGGGQLTCGGLPPGDLAIMTHSSLVFRSRDGGLSDRWSAKTPMLGATIELMHKPVLRVIPMLTNGGLLDGPLSLVVDQREGVFSSLGSSQHEATLGIATVVSMQGNARYARVLLRAGKQERLVAMKTVKLTQGDQDAILEVGKDAFTITVVDGGGTPVPDACVLEQDELLGTTDGRGEVQILLAQSGPIDAMARGFDCAQIALAELRATRHIVLPPLTTLVVDARQAVRALGRGVVTIRGGFASPCSSRVSERLLSEWNERGPSSGLSSGENGGRMMLGEVGYEVTAEKVLTLVGMFQPGEVVRIGLSDRGNAETGVERTVQLVRGEVTTVELPLPVMTQWSGELVSAKDGQSITEAKVQLSGSMWPQESESVHGGRIDLCLAKDSAITISANGYVTHSFARPEVSGVYRLAPARRLRLSVVDATREIIACRGSLWDEGGQEYTAATGQAGSELQFDEVPDQALTAKLLRGGEVREFAVPADATSWTVEWR